MYLTSGNQICVSCAYCNKLCKPLTSQGELSYHSFFDKLIDHFTNEYGEIDFVSKFQAADNRLMDFLRKNKKERMMMNINDHHCIQLAHEFRGLKKGGYWNHCQLKEKCDGRQIKKCCLTEFEYNQLYNCFEYKCIITDVDFGDEFLRQYISLDRPYNEGKLSMNHALLMLLPLTALRVSIEEVLMNVIMTFYTMKRIGCNP